MKGDGQVFSYDGNTLLVEFNTVKNDDGKNTVYATAISDLDVFTFTTLEEVIVEEILKAAIQWKVDTVNKQARLVARERHEQVGWEDK